MANRVLNQKVLYGEEAPDEELPFVSFEQLNKMQKLCYTLVKKYQEEKKQLLLIINGTAGKL